MDRFVFSLSFVFAFPDTNKEIRTILQQHKKLPKGNYFGYYLELHEFWIEEEYFLLYIVNFTWVFLQTDYHFKANVTFPTETILIYGLRDEINGSVLYNVLNVD